MALNRVDDVRAADWLSQIHVNLSYVYKVSDTVFISGGNPFKAPNSYKKCLCLLGSTVLCRPQQQWSAIKKKITWSLFRQSSVRELPVLAAAGLNSELTAAFSFLPTNLSFCFSLFYLTSS